MMKKMWKMRKDKRAVSPVIATILMVAITVVLAAVLYVMVMGFGGSTASTAPAVTLQKNGATVTIAINPQTDLAKVGISVNGNATVLLSTLHETAAVSSVAWTFSQLNTGKVTTADTIVFTKVPTTNAKTIQLVYVPSGITGSDKQNMGNVVSF